jgi:hypothetical protein
VCAPEKERERERERERESDSERDRQRGRVCVCFCVGFGNARAFVRTRECVCIGKCFTHSKLALLSVSVLDKLSAMSKSKSRIHPVLMLLRKSVAPTPHSFFAS